MLEGIHEAFPDAAIYVRAYDRRSLIKLKGGPAKYVVREVLESAVRMARSRWRTHRGSRRRDAKHVFGVRATRRSDIP